MLFTARETPEYSLRHVVVIWAALFGILLGAFALTVGILNSSVYSAGGFVTSYLQALQRGDIDEALATPGVLTISGASTELLNTDALGLLDEIRITSDVDQGAGIHRVSFQAMFDEAPADGIFQVLQGESRFGGFSSWSFLQSPVSELWITPMHDAHFTVNGIDLISGNGASIAANYQVLVPGVFVLSHHSAYLTASPKTVTVTRPGDSVPVNVDIRASPEFVAAIQTQMNNFLDECTTQEVLFPTGCPFGQELSNRVESTPQWSMATYPEVTIEPGNVPGSWIVPETHAAAHLTVDVRSLFDGSLSTFDEDIPFGVSWVMTINGDRVDIRQ
ncbi:MAG: hypothetical protein IT190_02360 [Microbacteriaceae bacterium]|nr:hypothetical protein [Microbacteriaceae bacterium]